jgi:hypothetical protein
MQYPLVSECKTPAHAQTKPCLDSHDSGHECSLAHWLEVYMLVELSEREDGELKSMVFDDSLLLISK